MIKFKYANVVTKPRETGDFVNHNTEVWTKLEYIGRYNSKVELQPGETITTAIVAPVDESDGEPPLDDSLPICSFKVSKPILKTLKPIITSDTTTTLARPETKLKS